MGNAQAAMEKQLIELRLTAKQLQRESKKCEKNNSVAKSKVKTCIEKGDMSGAQIYAQNAIREKNQALNYLQLSSRIEAVSQRVNTAVKMGQVSKSMGKTVNAMDRVLKSMDVNKIGAVMDKFEENFETLDVRTAYMNTAMDQTSAGVTPEEEVAELMQGVADEHGLSLSADLAEAPFKAPVQDETQPVPDNLEARFAALNA